MALITKGKSHAKGEYASMDLTSVVGTLESHWVCLLYTSPSPRD